MKEETNEKQFKKDFSKFPSDFDINVLNMIENTGLQIKKKLLFLGWLNHVLKEKYGTRAILVGGSSVEAYSGGLFQTQDMDLVYVNNNELNEILIGVGFKKEGRYWCNETLDILLESPSGELAGDLGKVIAVNNIVDGKALTAYVIGVEDAVIDRLKAYFYWKDRESGLRAKNMIENNIEIFDIEYLYTVLSKNPDIEKFLEKQDKIGILTILKGAKE